MDIETRIKIERALQNWDFEPNNLPSEFDNLQINANEFLKILADHYVQENELGRNFWRIRNNLSQEPEWDEVRMEYSEMEDKIKYYKSKLKKYFSISIRNKKK